MPFYNISVATQAYIHKIQQYKLRRACKTYLSAERSISVNLKTKSTWG